MPRDRLKQALFLTAPLLLTACEEGPTAPVVEETVVLDPFHALVAGDLAALSAVSVSDERREAEEPILRAVLDLLEADLAASGVGT